MSRFGNQQTGVIVSVADEKDHRFGLGWKRLTDGEGFQPDGRPARRTRSHDDPTPSGQIRRPAREETPTGQIRRQQAQDPYRER